MKRSQHIVDLRKYTQSDEPQHEEDILIEQKPDQTEHENKEEVFWLHSKNKQPQSSARPDSPKAPEYSSMFSATQNNSAFASRPEHLSKNSSPVEMGNVAQFLYNSVVLFGKFIELIGKGIFIVLGFIKYLILSPIKALDVVLDLVAEGFKKTLRFLLINIIFNSLRGIWNFIKRLEFHPPYYWYKHVGVFALVGLAVIIPIKIFFEVPTIIKAQQQVRGVATQAAQYAALFNELKEYVPAATIAKEFLGFNGPRRFLVVFQNNAELRATGGFMGSYAVIDVKDGQITQMDVPGGGFYDLKGSITRKVEAPEPFHIFSPYWQIWNANWFADYPTSAKKLSDFYEQSGGSTVDGVVMLTPNVIEDLLKQIGPVELEEYNLTITDENFRRETQVQVEYEYDQEENKPKAFIGDLAPIVIERSFAALQEQGAKEFLNIIDENLAERQIMIYSSKPDIEQILDNLGWSAEIKNVPGDYLQIVHTNIGGGKTDIAIRDTISQVTEVLSDGSIVNEVSLTRSHTGDPEDIFEGHDNLDYMRFYVPKGSKLIEAEGFTNDDLSDRLKTTEEELIQDPELSHIKSTRLTDVVSGVEIYEETGKTVFAHWLGLKPGQTKTVTIRYRLPYEFNANIPYVMYWQKQAGAQGGPMNVTILLPEQYRFENWLPQNSHVNLKSDNQLVFTDDLRRDKYISFSVKNLNK